MITIPKKDKHFATYLLQTVIERNPFNLRTDSFIEQDKYQHLYTCVFISKRKSAFRIIKEWIKKRNFRHKPTSHV